MKNQIKQAGQGIRLNLFFVEMIIVLLFFSIASAVILRSFAGSDRLARESRRIEDMAFLAQSAAEIYSGTADLSETAEMLTDTDHICEYDPDEHEITVYMDNDVTGKMVETSDEYGGGSLKTLHISFMDGSGETLYELDTGAYIPERTVADGE